MATAYKRAHADLKSVLINMRSASLKVLMIFIHNPLDIHDHKVFDSYLISTCACDRHAPTMMSQSHWRLFLNSIMNIIILDRLSSRCYVYF